MFAPRSTYIAVAIALLGIASQAKAQNSASATVSANVQQPITVTKTNDLSFGSVFPGLNNSVAVTASGAASFSVQGQASANVNLTFTLPSNITSSSNTLPVANWVALYNTTNSSASGTSFTPSTSATSATLSSSGALYVFLGATAQPSISQAAGSYSGTATMTVVYF